MKTILLPLFFLLLFTSNSMAAIGCGADICDPDNSCYEGCPGSISLPKDIMEIIFPG